MSKEKEKDQTFEAGVTRLESVIEQLEDGELDLDRSLALFEEGIKLSRRLNRKLDEAEKKLELLLKDEEGEPRPEPFGEGPEESEDDLF